MARNPVVARLRASMTSDGAGRVGSDLQRVNLFVIPFLALCVGAVLAYFGFTANAGVALLWALCSLTAGGGVGFLFGIPRSGAAPAKAGLAAASGGKPGSAVAAAASDADRGNNLRPNTNLEEVSDWLTKIIVGLGLVNLADIGPGVLKIAALSAAGWTGIDAAVARSVAAALVVAFAVTGFLASYVYTRLFLQEAFGRADAQLDLAHAIDTAQSELPNAATDPNTPAMLSVQELKVAETIMQAAKVNDLPAMTEKMRSLAREYELIRQGQDSGIARTQQMANVVQKMRTLALATLPALADFARSGSPGERLAAVAMLQTRFDAAYTPWLAERLVDERPFVGFNAASALLTASRNLAGEPLRQLLDAVAAAQARLQALGLKEADRDKLIERILAQAPGGQGVPPTPPPPA